MLEKECIKTKFAIVLVLHLQMNRSLCLSLSPTHTQKTVDQKHLLFCYFNNPISKTCYSPLNLKAISAMSVATALIRSEGEGWRVKGCLKICIQSSHRQNKFYKTCLLS